MLELKSIKEADKRIEEKVKKSFLTWIKQKLTPNGRRQKTNKD